MSHPIRPSIIPHTRDDASITSTQRPENIGDEDPLGQFGQVDHVDSQRILSVQCLHPDTEEIVHENLETLEPRLQIRNTDVFRLHVTFLTLQLFNHIWRQPQMRRLSAPFCVTFDTIPLAENRGLVASVCHENFLSPTVLRSWACRSLSAVGVDRLMRSAAGALTRGYVLVLQMPSGREIALKDDVSLFWKEAVGLFESPGNGVRTSFPKRLRDILKELKEWDVFRKVCVEAFRAVRESWEEIKGIVLPLFVICGIRESRISEFVHSRWSLGLKHKRPYLMELRFRRWLG